MSEGSEFHAERAAMLPREAKVLWNEKGSNQWIVKWTNGRSVSQFLCGKNSSSQSETYMVFGCWHILAYPTVITVNFSIQLLTENALFNAITALVTKVFCCWPRVWNNLLQTVQERGDSILISSLNKTLGQYVCFPCTVQVLSLTYLLIYTEHSRRLTIRAFLKWLKYRQTHTWNRNIVKHCCLQVGSNLQQLSHNYYFLLSVHQSTKNLKS